jgi:hypothetical protein
MQASLPILMLCYKGSRNSSRIRCDRDRQTHLYNSTGSITPSNVQRTLVSLDLWNISTAT